MEVKKKYSLKEISWILKNKERKIQINSTQTKQNKIIHNKIH